jgi:dUTP pyrophosphatase
MKISKTKDVKTPQRSGRAAGIDFFIPNDFSVTTINPGEDILIDLGIKVSIPKDYCLIAFNKSGVAIKGLSVGACVIDEDYQGPIHLHLFNVSKNPVKIMFGQKIIQFLLIPVWHQDIEEVPIHELYSEKSERGSGGFGSTGTN